MSRGSVSPLTNGNSPYNSSPSSTQPMTRTVAIIKNHALNHRFEVEKRIQEASFEIVKERQMEFDVESDPEFMQELFGEDVESLAEGPVWVYVLERRRAVEVWNTLMGDRDPEVARQTSSTALRGLYGISKKQNGLMGSPDADTAELQIQSLFASSPPFPISDLPDSRFQTMNSVDSAVLSQLRNGSEDGYAQSNVTSDRTNSVNGTRLSTSGNPHFKARALPTTHLAPDIAPRTTKAAALRAAGYKRPTTGIFEKTAPREALSKERLAQTFTNVPGHKRAESIAVASTAAPTIAPRMTRAASLRINGGASASPVKKAVRPPTTTTTTKTAIEPEKKTSTFEGVPGHKRRETISVASVQAPTIAPRQNRSAALRASKEQAAPPSSFMFRTDSAAKVPGLARSNSTSNLSPQKPATISRSSSRQSYLPPRPASATPRAPSVAAKTNGAANGTTNGTAPRVVPRPSSIGVPTIAPRTNKSAALRAAKKAEEEAAAAAAAAKKYGRPRPQSRVGVGLS